MKETYYLIRTDSGRMGGNDSFSSMSEKELFKPLNQGLLSCPYTTIYQLMDKKSLASKIKKIKRSPLELKEFEEDSLIDKLQRSYRWNRLSGPNKEESAKREDWESQLKKVRAEIKKLRKKEDQKWTKNPKHTVES